MTCRPRTYLCPQHRGCGLWAWPKSEPRLVPAAASTKARPSFRDAHHNRMETSRVVGLGVIRQMELVDGGSGSAFSTTRYEGSYCGHRQGHDHGREVRSNPSSIVSILLVSPTHDPECQSSRKAVRVRPCGLDPGVLALVVQTNLFCRPQQ